MEEIKGSRGELSKRSRESVNVVGKRMSHEYNNWCGGCGVLELLKHPNESVVTVFPFL